VLLVASVAPAQQQENKLIDRLLRPNMELRNPAQNKKFTAVEGVSNNRRFSAREFYVARGRPVKSFWGVRSLLSKTFGTGNYARAEAAANYRQNAEMPDASRHFSVKKPVLGDDSSFAKKKTETRDYADNRPFLAEGTRQKQLSQQGRPLSIDQVRELLNKNR
jgi:hypothetical protein